MVYDDMNWEEEQALKWFDDSRKEVKKLKCENAELKKQLKALQIKVLRNAAENKG